MAAKKGHPRYGGRTKGTPNKVAADVKALALIYGPEAIETLGKIMRESADERSKIAASKELLDRAYGKATQTIAGEDGREIIFKVYGFDPERRTGG